MLSDVSVIRLMWVAFLPKPVKKVKVLKKKKRALVPSPGMPPFK